MPNKKIQVGHDTVRGHKNWFVKWSNVKIYCTDEANAHNLLGAMQKSASLLLINHADEDAGL